ncbi:aldehyde dehydrogenase (NADP(+)) [Arthrobacter sp. CAU 1506]|uniref:aldehyde dehydrogenase (NADP(+)) n=1 Tax=Arthrobacter sp. CAU 1506 TaxID=2560052 RepID=UPI0010AC01FA|nr:aldehyde dehydrogenase (NADP(+)) [Arthrobacter sp. CAU 1506]TJY69677.1 aldehyde dehydrogenase (NADP(+)) [Arthrobacter sp. CAU 1506]
MPITGRSIIASEPTVGSHGSTRAINPATGESLDPEFTFVGPADVDAAAKQAAEAFDTYRTTAPDRRAAFLEAIAANLDSIKDEVVQRAHQETGLPLARLQGEHGRTTGQLRMFAAELRLGAHHEVRIDRAQPDRLPAAAPDIRQRQIPLGPVAVFGASNFPLAFSTAGGDTASALAAGCPVIVKAHNAHPGTAELVGQAVTQAVSASGLPAGTFSILFGSGSTIGQELAAHPAVKAIGFTGSQAAGTDLMRTAAARPEPIPVYAEMSSINPVVILPEAMQADPESLADGFVGSLTLGAGQFCTNPGLLFVPKESQRFVERASAAVSGAHGQTMLSPAIATSYQDGIAALDHPGVEPLAAGLPGDTFNAPAPALFRTTVHHFMQTPDLQEEVFGSAALLVEYADAAELREALEGLHGQLTATIHSAPADGTVVRDILPVLERKVGRILFNGWPTGVEVNHTMVHGGPFPATSDSRTTSVGSLAIYRFQRPVSYQNVPAEFLPPALTDDNPWSLPRRIDGTLHTS